MHPSTGLVAFVRSAFALDTSPDQGAPSLRTNPLDWFDYFDEDHGGSLDKDEGVRAIIKTFNLVGDQAQITQTREMMDAVWCIFDDDGSGASPPAGRFCHRSSSSDDDRYGPGRPSLVAMACGEAEADALQEIAQRSSVISGMAGGFEGDPAADVATAQLPARNRFASVRGPPGGLATIESQRACPESPLPSVHPGPPPMSTPH